MDNALYRAAIAKHHGIANEKLVEMFLALIVKLLETSGARVLSSGWGRKVRKIKIFYCAKCKSQNPKLQYQNAGIRDSEIRLINNKVENIFEQ